LRESSSEERDEIFVIPPSKAVRLRKANFHFFLRHLRYMLRVQSCALKDWTLQLRLMLSFFFMKIYHLPSFTDDYLFGPVLPAPSPATLSCFHELGALKYYSNVILNIEHIPSSKALLIHQRP